MCPLPHPCSPFFAGRQVLEAARDAQEAPQPAAVTEAHRGHLRSGGSWRQQERVGTDAAAAAGRGDAEGHGGPGSRRDGRPEHCGGAHAHRWPGLAWACMASWCTGCERLGRTTWSPDDCTGRGLCWRRLVTLAWPGRAWPGLARLIRPHLARGSSVIIKRAATCGWLSAHQQHEQQRLLMALATGRAVAVTYPLFPLLCLHSSTHATTCRLVLRICAKLASNWRGWQRTRGSIQQALAESPQFEPRPVNPNTRSDIKPCIASSATATAHSCRPLHSAGRRRRGGGRRCYTPAAAVLRLANLLAAAAVAACARRPLLPLPLPLLLRLRLACHQCL